MTEHTWHKCKDSCNGCQFCDGGLGWCTVCGAFEGQLLSSCPGETAAWEREATNARLIATVEELVEQRARIAALPMKQALAWQRLLQAAEELVATPGFEGVRIQLHPAAEYRDGRMAWPKPIAAAFT